MSQLVITEIELDPLTALDETRVGSCLINGIRHHITAIPVDGFGASQKPRDRENSTAYDALCEFERVRPGFMTVPLDGQSYVLVITPYCQ